MNRSARMLEPKDAYHTYVAVVASSAGPEGAAVRRTGVDMHHLGGRRARENAGRERRSGRTRARHGMVSSSKNEEEEMADSADDRGGHATTSARRERVDSVRPFRFELRLSHNPWRVVPAPTDGRAARRRPARAASNAPARHAGHQAILEGARPSNLRAHSAPSRTRARTRHPKSRATLNLPPPPPSPSPAQSPHLRAKSASPPTDDDNKGFGDDDSPRWANVGRWRHHSKLAPSSSARKKSNSVSPSAAGRCSAPP